MGILNKKMEAVPHPKNLDFFLITGENEKMKWGIEKAKLTFHYFQKCLKNPKDGQHNFSIRAGIQYQGKKESIWLTEPSMDKNGDFIGILSKAPSTIKDLKLNQKIEVAKQSISDWMFVENKRLIGGYTLRAIREELGTDQLKDFDHSIGGMQIDAGEDYFLSNFETPEGAILCLEEAYTNKDVNAAIACKDFDKEAAFLLNKSIHTIADTDKNLIKRTSELLQSYFILDLKENGFPNFSEFKRAFKRFKITEEHYIISELCYHSNGAVSSQKFHTIQVDEKWKVLGMED